MRRRGIALLSAALTASAITAGVLTATPSVDNCSEERLDNLRRGYWYHSGVASVTGDAADRARVSMHKRELDACEAHL